MSFYPPAPPDPGLWAVWNRMRRRNRHDEPPSSQDRARWNILGYLLLVVSVLVVLAILWFAGLHT